MEVEIRVVARRSIGEGRQHPSQPTMQPRRRVIGISETRCRQWCPASSGNLNDGMHGQAAEAASTRRPIHSGASKLSSMSMLTTRWSAMRLHRTRRSSVREDMHPLGSTL
uniref:Uncharacterized protein n=1 Tax=Oryza meridionalis TaxID=40149 RepID=A0A0E0DZ93_9ORYZ